MVAEGFCDGRITKIRKLVAKHLIMSGRKFDEAVQGPKGNKDCRFDVRKNLLVYSGSCTY